VEAQDSAAEAAYLAQNSEDIESVADTVDELVQTVQTAAENAIDAADEAETSAVLAEATAEEVVETADDLDNEVEAVIADVDTTETLPDNSTAGEVASTDHLESEAIPEDSVDSDLDTGTSANVSPSTPEVLTDLQKADILSTLNLTGIDTHVTIGEPTLLVGDPDGDFQLNGTYYELTAGGETSGIETLSFSAGAEQISFDRGGDIRLNGELIGNANNPEALETVELGNGASISQVISDSENFEVGQNVLQFTNDEYRILAKVFDDRGGPEVVFYMEELTETAGDNATGDEILTLLGTTPEDIPEELELGLHHFLLQSGRDGVISF
jgi:hypothetical protein